jgi:hypothetical protein
LDKSNPHHAEEYSDMENLFLSTINSSCGRAHVRNPNAKVIEISRIQNKELYRRYYMCKKSIEKKYENLLEVLDKKFLDEKLLFHGTNTTEPSVIYTSKEGIDRRFTTANLHGDGSYFATGSWYSAQSGFIYQKGNI